MQEVWKDIDGYVGFYQVSNFGRVKSVSRVCGTKQKQYTCKEKLLSQSLCKGYYKVTLYKDGISKQFRVNRLVAITFIPNPNNLPIVNHIDENPKNNRIDNLEWCTIKYNTLYGDAVDKIRKSRVGKHASKDTKERMSIAHLGNKNGMYGKKHTSEAKALISKNRKRTHQESNE